MFSVTHKKNLKRSIYKRLASTVLLSSCTLLGANAIASGSFGGGSSFSGHDSYNLGKSVFHKKLACADCPANGIKMNQLSATELINSLKMDPEFASDLSDKNRKAAIKYLSRRFKIN